MTRIGYLLEIPNAKGQRTDLFELWPKPSCKWCNGTGNAGMILVRHKKHRGDGPAVMNLCGCLMKQEQRKRREQCR